MKTVGLIAEYNPFHNGHRYHMEQARALAKADFVLVVMSGDFVQRGAPAIYDKYARTQMALLAGADLVVELPSIFATSSAEDFAAASIALLDQLGVVDCVCFGSECGQLDHLSSIADILLREPLEYSTVLRESMKQGLTFPQSRKRALSSYWENQVDLWEVLDSPNNILGIEYMKALKKRQSPMEPITILREGRGYHDLDPHERFGSASAIRHMLPEADSLDSIAPMVPDFVLSRMKTLTPVWTDDFTSILNHTLLTLIREEADLTQYLDLSSDLAARIRRNALDFCSFEERVESLKTKQYTYTRISRALLHLVLGIRFEDLSEFRTTGDVAYGRILGFRSAAAPLMSRLKKESRIPLITKTAHASRRLSPDGYRCLRQDFFSSHLYQSVLGQKTGILPKNEFNRQIDIH